MTDAPRVLFHPDFGPTVGGGHALRCLTLAGALIAQGAACAFALSPATAKALAPFIPAGVEVLAPGAPWGAQAVVLDHYGLGAEQEAPFRAAGAMVCVIDDLADRPHDCDLLVDPGYDRQATAYEGLVPKTATILTGPAHALLRPEFAAGRKAALGRRGDGPVERVLVSLGLTDLGGITERVVAAILPLLGETHLAVALAHGAPSAGYVRGLDPARVTAHFDATDMAGLMTRADLAIGAGGSSVWERACMGLPSLCLVLADNQAPMANLLEHDGLTVALDARGEDPPLAQAYRRLADNGRLRHILAVKSAAACDGQGAGRVAEALLAKLGQRPRAD